MANAPDPAAVKASFRKPNGFLKLITLVLIIICIGLARGGRSIRGEIGFPIDLNERVHPDYSWLVITTTCGFCIITLLLIIGRAMGGMPIQVELVALLLGTIMFVASGSVVIDTHRTLTGNSTALALGSMCIITGLVMFIDMALTGKDMKN